MKLCFYVIFDSFDLKNQKKTSLKFYPDRIWYMGTHVRIGLSFLAEICYLEN